ncbi:MAG: N-formylglutamate amidohydrolase [Pseudomonadota bacterium]
MTLFAPVEHISPGSSPRAMTNLLLLCDHARNAVPPEIGDLGLTTEDMGRHIAWDVGARGLTLALAARLGAGAVLSTFSRLVIDPNRGEDDPTLVMRLYDGSIIPGNRAVDEVEVERRLDAYYRPYHRAVTAALDRIEKAGETPVIASIHSFTPSLRGRPPRPWHVGVLWDRDGRLALPMIRLLSAEGDLCIGDNEPYSGQLQGDCMWRHGTGRGIAHALIELRSDLISTPDGQADWAARMDPVLREAVAEAIGSPTPGIEARARADDINAKA